MEETACKTKKRGRPVGSTEDAENLVFEEGQEQQQRQPSNSWHILFTASTRPHFLQIFINWRKSTGTIEELSTEGLRGAYMASGEILYYYDFLNCHQYSKVMMQKLINIPTEKLEKDFRRYVCMIANDNRVVGKLLQKSVGRKVVWHKRKRPDLKEN